MQESWSSNQPPSVFQESHLPYQNTWSYQNRTQQPEFSPRLQTTEVVSNCNVPQTLCSNTNTCVPFQRNQCDGPINQSFSQQLFTAQPQNYHEQALKYWSSDHGRSRPMPVADDNTRGWSYQSSDNGRFCSISNLQQPLAPKPANLHHQLHQHSGQQQTPGRLLVYQGQCGTTVCYAYSSSVTLPSAEPEKNNSFNKPLLMNCQQSRTELNSTLNSSGHTNSNIHQSSQDQFNSTSRPDLNLKHYFNTKLYQLLCLDDNKQDFCNSLATNMQSSDNRTVCNSKNVFSEINSHSVVEPPSKKINPGETQRGFFNQLPTINTNVSKENNMLKSRSALTDTHQKGRMDQNRTEKRQSRTGQSKVIYSTDPVDCLEAVYALQKSLQQVNKAVAIVPPISQQTSNPEEMHNVSPQVVDSPPLKISAVWSLSEVCDSQSPLAKVNDKLTHDPSLTVEEDDKIRTKNETLNDVAGAGKTQHREVGSAGPPAEIQNNMLQRNCDLSDDVFELSNVPVAKHTLEELMKLVKCLETTESSSEYTEKPGSVCDRILELFWNGNKENLMKHIKALNKVRRYSVVESVKNDKSVVFESIAPENLKKLSNCAVVNNNIYSLSEEFRSSWLNADGQPADISKVLSEPLSDDITLPRDTSQIARNFTPVTEITSPSAEEHMKPHSEGPEDVCTSCEENAENGGKETATQNKVHSDADTPGALLCHDPNQQKTFKRPDDIIQHQKSLNTKPTDVSPVADVCSEETDFCISTQEVLKSSQLFVQRANLDSEPHDKLPVSDSLPVCPTDKPHVNSTNSRQIEDISDDESNNSLVMGVTVLSSEDALKFFQQFEKEPQRNIEKVHCSPKTNKTDVLHRKKRAQDQSPPSLKPEFPETSAAAVAHNADEGPAKKPEGESLSKCVLVKTSDIKSTVEISENISVSQLLTQCNKTSKSGGSLVRNPVKSRLERQDPYVQTEIDRTSQKSPETAREETSGFSAAAVTLEVGENPPVKKVRFALYGSHFKHQCDEQGQNFPPPASLAVSNAHRVKNQRVSQYRRFSAPATLTLSTACKDISVMSSARQKVHKRWSSTFISTVQRSSPSKSPQKKMQTTHEVLKSNMVPLKEHLKHRTMKLSDHEPQKH